MKSRILCKAKKPLSWYCRTNSCAGSVGMCCSLLAVKVLNNIHSFFWYISHSRGLTGAAWLTRSNLIYCSHRKMSYSLNSGSTAQTLQIYISQAEIYCRVVLWIFLPVTFLNKHVEQYLLCCKLRDLSLITIPYALDASSQLIHLHFQIIVTKRKSNTIFQCSNEYPCVVCILWKHFTM